jgi:hypothetical protein
MLQVRLISGAILHHMIASFQPSEGSSDVSTAAVLAPTVLPNLCIL